MMSLRVSLPANIFADSARPKNLIVSSFSEAKSCADNLLQSPAVRRWALRNRRQVTPHWPAAIDAIKTSCKINVKVNGFVFGLTLIIETCEELTVS